MPEIRIDRQQQPEKMMGDLLENIAVGLLVIDPRMEIIYLNKQMRIWHPSIDLSKRPLCHQSFGGSADSGLCTGCPARLTLEDGNVHEAVVEKIIMNDSRNFRIVSSPLLNADGQVAAVVELIQDVTEGHHIHAQIRNLTQKLIRAQENERTMISRELHDNLAQKITGAKMICDRIMGGSDAPEPPIRQSITKVVDILMSCVEDIRRLAYDLRPPGLKQIGLIETLRQYALDFSENFDIAVDFQAGGFRKIVPGEDLSINLFRLVQEALNNVRKHASASKISVRLIASHPNLILRVEDNGVGFDVARRQATITREKKLGLRSMQERVELLNGVMTVKSKPGCGTKLFIKIPAEGRDHETQKNHLDRG